MTIDSANDQETMKTLDNVSDTNRTRVSLLHSEQNKISRDSYGTNSCKSVYNSHELSSGGKMISSINKYKSSSPVSKHKSKDKVYLNGNARGEHKASSSVVISLKLGLHDIDENSFRQIENQIVNKELQSRKRQKLIEILSEEVGDNEDSKLITMRHKVLKKKSFESPYFKNKEKLSTNLMKRNLWIPPKSPYKLIQEELYYDPWKLLIGTIFLNKTKGHNVTPLLHQFFEMWPTAKTILNANIEEVANLLQPLGLHHKKAYIIKRFSEDFLRKNWKYPSELYGIGKYGNDSYRIFCLGHWRQVSPSDHKLNAYHNWLCTNWMYLGLT